MGSLGLIGLSSPKLSGEYPYEPPGSSVDVDKKDVLGSSPLISP